MRFIVHNRPVDLSDPAAAFGPSRDRAILRALAVDLQPRSGRRLAVEAGVAHSTALRVLDRLVREGVVIELDAGRARLFRLNPDHVLAPCVIALATARDLLIERLRAEIATWSLPPVAALMFGSAARGDGDAESDVDVLLVRSGAVADRDEWGRQVDRLAERVRAWTGNHLGVVQLAPAALTSEQGLVAVVRSEGIELTDGAFRALLP
jgi:predicted nucleotidyltransferase